MSSFELISLDTGDKVLRAPKKEDEGILQGGSKVYGDQPVIGSVTNLQALRDAKYQRMKAGDSIYSKSHTTQGDGGEGNFRLVTGAAPGTYTDNNGTIIVPTGGDGSAAWIREIGALGIDVRWFGASPDATAPANFSAIQAALTHAGTIGGGTVFLPEGRDVYDIDCTASALNIYSDTTFDLGGNELHRTDATNRRTAGNVNFGGSVDKNIRVGNGKITGVGAPGSTTDQGSGITLYGILSGGQIYDLETNNTSGDGIGLRKYNGSLDRIRIGAYGRNGISPTSGIVTFNDVEVVGPTISGADPGKDIDSEINNTNEVSELTFNNVKARDCTVVDLVTSVDDEKFRIKFKANNCVFGPRLHPLRFKSTPRSTAAEIVIDESNIVYGTGTVPGITLDNVSGAYICPTLLPAPGANMTNSIGLNILGTVNALTYAPNISGYAFELQAVTTNRLNNAEITLQRGKRILLSGSGNNISAVSLVRLDLRQEAVSGDSLGNQFNTVEPIGTIVTSGGASVASQYFGGKRGKQSTALFNQQMTTGASDPGGSTVDMIVTLPDADAGDKGRVVMVAAGWSHEGRSTHMAHYLATVRYGVNSAAQATLISETTSANASIAFVSATATSVTLRLTYQFDGIFSAAVIG